MITNTKANRQALITFNFAETDKYRCESEVRGQPLTAKEHKKPLRTLRRNLATFAVKKTILKKTNVVITNTKANRQALITFCFAETDKYRWKLGAGSLEL